MWLAPFNHPIKFRWLFFIQSHSDMLIYIYIYTIIYILVKLHLKELNMQLNQFGR